MAFPPQGVSRFRWSQIFAYKDLLVAALVVAIVLLIVIPIPPFLLDILLALSITLSLVILLTTMFTVGAVPFSVFPTLLLVVTLYRLALNISSTRLILSEAQAGQIIQAFGTFVVGGNYVIGLVIFAIITVIQFVVITNGAGRVAEVAARFTLDAMPGKQMSIDADLNTGLVTEEEARERRRLLQREADFYGAMDGASKFVRGDAIAGIVIIFINILGGLVIGVWQHQMDFNEAVQVYTRLTVGDGLVAQIPALLVSTATGILITRAGATESFGQNIWAQLTTFPRVIGLVAVLLAFLGLIPGFPKLPFFILSAATGYTAYTLLQAEKAEEVKKHEARERPSREPENVLALFRVDPLEVELGYSLVPLAEEEKGGDLLDRLALVRRQCALELGIYVRPIRVRDNLQLPPQSYAFKIRGVEIARGEIRPNFYLAMSPATSLEPLSGIPTKEPAFGLPAWWIGEEEKERAEILGYTVVDAVTVLITHLTEFIRAHAAELLGKQEVKELLETLKETNPAAVEELVPDVLSLGEVQKVLQLLLQERVSIRDLVTVCEALADQARVSKDLDALVEAARQAVRRTIVRPYLDNGKLTVITLHSKLEQMLADALQPTPEGKYPLLPPETTRQLFSRLGKLTEEAARQGKQPVVLCSARIRLPFKRLADRFLPGLVVLSYQELTPGLEVASLGTVVLE